MHFAQTYTLADEPWLNGVPAQAGSNPIRRYLDYELDIFSQ